MLKAKEIKFNIPTNDILSYVPTALNVGSIIKQYSGPNPEDNFIGPAKIGMARPMEAGTAIAAIYPHVKIQNTTTDWVFCADGGAAAAARRIILYEYNKDTSVWNWRGYITLNIPPLATANTIRALRMLIENYTDGTVTSSGTTLTGSGTLWQASQMTIGSRIGFGSTDPEAITTWYEITNVVNDTTITLDADPGVSGSVYVIQDMKCSITTTNATAANGGVFEAKGLRVELFTPSGTTIASATTADNQRAVYWLADAAIVTNTTAAGLAIEPMTSWTEQYAYVVNVTGARIFKYNLRAPLTSIVAGKTTSAFVLATGNQAVTGTISQANNGRVATVNHGPGLGIPSLYFVTTTRVYRVRLSDITNGSITWQSDSMIEVPPGGPSTYGITNGFSSIEYSDLLDRFFIMTTGAAGVRSYCTKYNTNSDPFDHVFLVDDKQLDSSSADNDAVTHPVILALPFSVWIEGRILYLARIGTTALNNQIYTLPVAAHNTYAFDTNQIVITPEFDISDANKLTTFYTKSVIRLGSDTFSIQTEPFRTYYRTSGITDNSGIWTQLNDAGDLSGVSGSKIQFAYAFKVMGTTCVPGRLISCTLVYEDLSTDSHYQPSLNSSSIPDRIFAYRQAADWGGNIPILDIRLYNADTNVLILADTTNTEVSGTFEYSTDGSTWNPWDNTQNTVGNYIRYTADSLPGGVKVRATLIQA